LSKAWPILDFSANKEILLRAEEELRQAQREFDTPNTTNCVRAAGYACESLLKVMYESKGRRELSEVKLTYDDYLRTMTGEISEDFGKNTLEDLVLIRDMRNTHSHPGAPKPTLEEAFRVLRRAQMFFEQSKLRDEAQGGPLWGRA